MLFKLKLLFFMCATIVSSGFIDNVIKISNFDSDAFSDSFDLLTKYGYTPEKHVVKTKDEYLITIFRIPRDGPPVLMLHGVTDSSDEWLVLGPKQSLAFQLADKGFDVWLLNSRGNRYSKGHQKSLPPEQYWDFSYEEIGTYDLPASIDYILKVTSQQKLSYVGFSQGTIGFFVLCSMIPEYNNKIAQAILLAPVAWLANIRNPFIGLASETLDFITLLTSKMGLYELLPFNPNKALSRINCYNNYAREICTFEYFQSFGLMNASYLSLDRMAVVDSHLPAGVSTKTLIHYIQGFKGKKFQRFDYGAQKNLEKYSSEYPPTYNVSLVSAPVSIMASAVDWLSQRKDVMTLKQKLPNVRSFKMFNENLQFSHLEFVYGSRINDLVNEPVIKMLLQEKDYNFK